MGLVSGQLLMMVLFIYLGVLCQKKANQKKK
jgi:hypothetical protein